MKQPDRTLVAALDPFMTAHGFKFIGSHGGYYRKYASGFDYFSWGSYPLATGKKWEAGYYEGHYGIGLRSDAIDALSSVVMPLYGGEKFQRYAFTVYRAVAFPPTNLFAFDPLRDRELCLRFDHLEADVAGTVGRIEAMLEADGWAWYKRYADPAALSQGLNDPIGGGVHPLLNNDGNRPLVGIAAACVGEPERVSALVDGWLSVARGWDEQAAGQRPSQVDEYTRKFALITDKARELGYAI